MSFVCLYIRKFGYDARIAPQMQNSGFQDVALEVKLGFTVEAQVPALPT